VTQPRTLPVTAADVERAARRIDGHVTRTPTTVSRTLSEITGADVVIKFENLQFTGSFKERGALNKLLSLSPEERAGGVVAMSAGNYAQAVAYHATRLGVASTVVMPVTTPNIKAERTRVLGADVVREGADVDEAAQYAEHLARDGGRVLLRPFDDPEVIAGQGTLALEMLADDRDLELLVVPVGGGGLVAGAAVAVQEVDPDVEVIGVQSEMYPSMVRALAGEPAPAGGPTIAEGIAVREAGALTRDIVGALGVDVVTVREASIEEAIALYLEIEKVVAEGAGAAALAALLEDPQRFGGRRVGLVLSGGNIDLQLLASVIVRSLVRTGRLVTIRVTVPDIPGSLGRVTAVVGEAGGNIIDVHHRRHMLAVPTKAAQLDLTVEVASGEAASALVEHVRTAGFGAEVVPGGVA
jgi:threonine dehydratase